MKMKGGMGWPNATDIRDLIFTKTAIIYYQSILSVPEQASIIEAFKSYGIDVQFRGSEYEAFRHDAWLNSHKKQ